MGKYNLKKRQTKMTFFVYAAQFLSTESLMPILSAG